MHKYITTITLCCFFFVHIHTCTYIQKCRTVGSKSGGKGHNLTFDLWLQTTPLSCLLEFTPVDSIRKVERWREVEKQDNSVKCLQKDEKWSWFIVESLSENDGSESIRFDSYALFIWSATTDIRGALNGQKYVDTDPLFLVILLCGSFYGFMVMARISLYYFHILRLFCCLVCLILFYLISVSYLILLILISI